MALTKAEELLLRGLKLFKLRRGNVILAMMLMDTEEKRWVLMEYMAKNENATENEIIAEAYRISQNT